MQFQVGEKDQEQLIGKRISNGTSGAQSTQQLPPSALLREKEQELSKKISVTSLCSRKRSNVLNNYNPGAVAPQKQQKHLAVKGSASHQTLENKT